ncbi:MAG: efflux RND transporter periplasmic adaptor subunit [Verrucomicrobia bacterium]|nr:efflux RND transporter periplasmic adaptor subunit [Verrucomicrobiota bacterium]
MSRRRSPQWIVYLAGIVAAEALTMFAWSAVEDRAQPVHVAIVQSVPGYEISAGSAALLEATGYVVARRRATVGPKIAGKLRDVLVEEGMHVDDGQVIAHLDDSNALAALNYAKATLEQAQITEADQRPILERNKGLVEKRVVSPDSYESVKATYDRALTAVTVARTALAVAQQNEDDTVVKAPFSGTVTMKAAQPGEIISPVSAGAGFTRTGIATIVDMNSLEVEPDVNEALINRVRVDQSCTVTLNAYPDWQIPGHVVAVIPTAVRTKATVRVRIAIDVKDSRIFPGMGARVEFLPDAKSGTKSRPQPAGVLVPPEAIATTGNEDIVFVVRDDRVERRAVKLGERTSAGQLVLSGLSKGETVAVSGLGKLADGAEIRIEQ